MPEDATPPARLGLDALSFAGAQCLEGGYCHGADAKITGYHSVTGIEMPGDSL